MHTVWMHTRDDAGCCQRDEGARWPHIWGLHCGHTARAHKVWGLQLRDDVNGSRELADYLFGSLHTGGIKTGGLHSGGLYGERREAANGSIGFVYIPSYAMEHTF